MIFIIPSCSPSGDGKRLELTPSPTFYTIREFSLLYYWMDGTKECRNFSGEKFRLCSITVPNHPLLADVGIYYFIVCLFLCVFLTNTWFCIAYNCLFSFQCSSESFHTKISVHHSFPFRVRKALVREYAGEAIRSDGRKSIYDPPYPVKVMYGPPTLPTCRNPHLLLFAPHDNPRTL